MNITAAVVALRWILQSAPALAAESGAPPASTGASTNASAKASTTAKGAKADERSKGIIQDVDPPSGAPVSGRKDGNVANSCITYEPVNASGAATQSPPSMTGRTQGRKTGSARADCDPMTASQRTATGSTAESPRVVRTFASGTKLNADVQGGGVRNYSAVDARGRALKVTVLREPPKGVIPGPGDTIVRSKLRADEEHARWMARMREQIESGGRAIGKGCWIVIGTLGSATDAAYMECPKGI